MYKLTQETANKCFLDLNIPLSSEVSFEQFLEWMLKKPSSSPAVTSQSLLNASNNKNNNNNNNNNNNVKPTQ